MARLLGISVVLGVAYGSVAACGSFGEAGSPPAEGGTSADTATPDGGGPVACNLEAGFAMPAPFMAPINGVDSNEYAGNLVNNDTLYIASDRNGAAATFIATRVAGDVWSQPQSLVTNARNPCPTRDQRTLYFDSERSGVPLIYISKRASTSESFGVGAVITKGALAAPHEDLQPWIANRGLYFASRLPGGKLSIWFAPRESRDGPEGVFQVPVELTELGIDAQSPVLTDDELTIFYSAVYDGTADVFTARRATVDARFGEITRLGTLSTDGNDFPTWVDPQGCSLIIESPGQASKFDLFYATRAPR